MFLQLLLLGVIGVVLFDKKKKKTTETYHQGGDEITEVTFHDTGKKVVYKNGKRVR